ncbi:hypothetical protein Hanom_Chr04g00363251 [Helianthus anomalus]
MFLALTQKFPIRFKLFSIFPCSCMYILLDTVGSMTKVSSGTFTFHSPLDAIL